MRKQDLVRKVSVDTGISQGIVRAIINSFLEEISLSLEKGERIELRKFGVFKVAYRKGREMIHPRLRKKIIIPGKRYPLFKPGKTIKERIR